MFLIISALVSYWTYCKVSRELKYKNAYLMPLYIVVVSCICGVPQGSILGPILSYLYNDLTSVSEYCFSVLIADDTNMFLTGKDMYVSCHQLNEDLRNVQEWLQCNKLSLIVLKTHYMFFTPRNRVIGDIVVKIQEVQIQRVNATKCLGVQIDSRLTWRIHI